MKRKLWIVTELFYPEETSTAYILTKIANKMIHNYDVHVICGPANYEKQKIDLNASGYLCDLVIIKRVSGINLDKNNLLSRFFRFLFLSFRLSFELLKNVSKNDKVLIVTNPAPLLLLVAVLKRFCRFHFFVLVHDVFPENIIPAGIIRSSDTILYKLLKLAFDRAYSKADLLIVLGRDMKRIIEKKIAQFSKTTNANIQIIENWSELNLIKNLPRRQALHGLPSNKIIIQYAGNLGRVQGLMNLLEIIGKVNNDSLFFSFWGDGVIKHDMEKYISDHDLNNIIFHGNFLRNQQNEVLNACDLAIITLADGMCGLGVPSKTYNIMAAGKPILYIGDKESEVGCLIGEYGFGYCYESTDNDGILAFLQKLSVADLSELQEKGLEARRIAEVSYAEDIILNKFSKVI